MLEVRLTLSIGLLSLKMETMSATNVRDRELMMVAMTSSTVKGAGACSEFAVVGMVSFRMMCLHFRVFGSCKLCRQWHSKIGVGDHCREQRIVLQEGM